MGRLQQQKITASQSLTKGISDIWQIHNSHDHLLTILKKQKEKKTTTRITNRLNKYRTYRSLKCP